MDYDVALSFAGEDRKYVEEVAYELRKLGVQVFYDKFETTNLWGKDLYTYLQNIYQKRARFTVIFISEHYAKKLWTNHERKMAQARAFNESEEYILPARFDDTEIEGIPSTTAFIDLRNYSPQEFSILIQNKLGFDSTNSKIKEKIEPQSILEGKIEINRERNYKLLLGLVSGIALLIFIIVFASKLFVTPSDINSNASGENKPQTVLNPPSNVSKSKTPTFTEGVDRVMLSVGSNRLLSNITNLKNGKYSFFVGNIPAVLYFEDGRPFVDVALYTPPDELPVSLKHNQLLNRPSSFDMNTDDTAIEVVDNKNRPIFQLYYDSPTHIVMNGVFTTKYGTVIAHEKSTETLDVKTLDLLKKPFPIKPIFKYPSSQYKGERLNQNKGGA